MPEEILIFHHHNFDLELNLSWGRQWWWCIFLVDFGAPNSPDFDIQLSKDQQSSSSPRFWRLKKSRPAKFHVPPLEDTVEPAPRRPSCVRPVGDLRDCQNLSCAGEMKGGVFEWPMGMCWHNAKDHTTLYLPNSFFLYSSSHFVWLSHSRRTGHKLLPMADSIIPRQFLTFFYELQRQFFWRFLDSSTFFSPPQQTSSDIWYSICSFCHLPALSGSNAITILMSIGLRQQ